MEFLEAGELDYDPTDLEGAVLTLRDANRDHEAWHLTISDPYFDASVRSLAERYVHKMCRSPDLVPDAINEGRIEVRKAIRGWDPDKGTYRKYAVGKAWSGITLFLGNNGGVVRTPKSTRELLIKLRKAIGRGDQVHDTNDIVRILGVKERTAIRLYQCLRGQQEVSLDKPVSEEDDRTLSDLLGSVDPNLEKKLGQEGLAKLLLRIKKDYFAKDARRDAERNWKWFAAYFGIVEHEGDIRVVDVKRTYKEIGEEEGVKPNVVHGAIARLLMSFRKSGYFQKIVEEILEGA